MPDLHHRRNQFLADATGRADEFHRAAQKAAAEARRDRQAVLLAGVAVIAFATVALLTRRWPAAWMGAGVLSLGALATLGIFAVKARRAALVMVEQANRAEEFERLRRSIFLVILDTEDEPELLEQARRELEDAGAKLARLTGPPRSGAPPAEAGLPDRRFAGPLRATDGVREKQGAPAGPAAARNPTPSVASKPASQAVGWRGGRASAAEATRSSESGNATQSSAASGLPASP